MTEIKNPAPAEHDSSSSPTILPGGEEKIFLVTPAEAKLRLDVFLTKKAALPRAQIQKAVQEGRAKVNNSPVKAGYRLKPGDRVWLHLPEVKPYELMAEEIPLNIVYEDEDLLVVDKPAGLVVHPSFGHPGGTLVNAILAHCRDLTGIGGVQRPGIVHRLDKDTSGLLVVAKTETSHRSLTEQFKQRKVEKEYLALVYGNLDGDEGLVDLPVGRDRVDRKKISIRTSRGKEARTHWRVLERYGAASFLALKLETGRTHQIRVHLSAMGHPLLGDLTYGGAKRAKAIADDRLRQRIQGLSRHALHAARLAFFHPSSNAFMSFTSPLPKDLEELRDLLKSAGR